MGWLLVMFDLPVMTDKQRKQATKFRTDLLDDGYFMMQYSIYVRSGVSYERLKKHSKRLRELSPKDGFIRALFLTDRQWQEGINIVGVDGVSGNHFQEADLPEQIEFW